MDQIKRKIDWTQLASITLIILLTVEVFLLIRENKQLRTALAGYQPVQLKPGERAESFKIESLEGAAGEFTYSDPGRNYLLFIFSTTCSHCENTMVYWQHIAANGKDSHCNIVGVSMDSPGETKKYASQKNLSFPVVSIADSGFGQKYKISGVPTTVLVRGDGVVEQSWYGELSAAQSDDIEHLMNARPTFKN